MTPSTTSESKHLHFCYAILLSLQILEAGLVIRWFLQGWTNRMDALLSCHCPLIKGGVVWCVYLLPWSVLVLLFCRSRKCLRFRTFLIVFPALLLIYLDNATTFRYGSTEKGGLIAERGVFPSPSRAYQVEIGSKSWSLVDYKIVNVATKQEYSPKYLFSDAMQWAAYWQDDDTLWVDSSDIGLSVWKRNSQGAFSHEWLGKESDLVPTIPAEIWNFLPSCLKHQWEPLRQHKSEQPADGKTPKAP